MVVPTNYKEVKFKILNLCEKIANPWGNLALPNLARKSHVIKSANEKISPLWIFSILCQGSTPVPKTSITLDASTKF